MAPGKTKALNLQAAEWFARLQGADAASVERDFEHWVSQDPARAVAFARVEATWERAARLAADGQVGDARRPGPRGAIMTRRMAAGLALGVVSAGGGGALWAVAHGRRYQTGVGERRTIDLADGSRVILNTASRIAVAYSAQRRDIHLTRGEAQFEVAKDASRPFVVHAGEAQVRAVGTAFNIRMRGDVAEVTVTEGVVSILERGKPIAPGPAPGDAPHVRAGGGAVVGPGAIAQIALDDDAMRTRTAWQDGVIELRGETLEQVAAEFNRYSDRKLVVGDPRIASIRVGGTFGVNEADKFVTALENGFGVRAVPGDGGAIYLVPAS